MIGMIGMIGNRTAEGLLRDVARDACDAANWFTRYDRSGNPEHRRNALMAVMDARDKLERIESAITTALGEPARSAG